MERAGIDRRELLKLGALAAVGVSTGERGTPVASAAEAEGPKATVVPPEEAYKLVQPELAKVPPFGDPSFDQNAANACPPAYPTKLPEPDEATEVVLSLLWLAFATGAAEFGVKLVTPDAIVYGRNRMRAGIRAAVVATGCDRPGTECGLASFPWSTTKPRWIDGGKKAGDAAAQKSQDAPVIDRATLASVWPPGPSDGGSELPPIDEATEVIGDHAWVSFMLSVLAGADKTVSEEAVRQARVMSRYYVRDRVVTRQVTDGTRPPDYTKWPFLGLTTCATLAGERARRNAAADGASAIVARHFEDAWCQTSHGLKLYAKKHGLDFGTMADGCGG